MNRHCTVLPTSKKMFSVFRIWKGNKDVINWTLNRESPSRYSPCMHSQAQSFTRQQAWGAGTLHGYDMTSVHLSLHLHMDQELRLLRLASCDGLQPLLSSRQISCCPHLHTGSAGVIRAGHGPFTWVWVTLRTGTAPLWTVCVETTQSVSPQDPVCPRPNPEKGEQAINSPRAGSQLGISPAIVLYHC